MIKIVTAFVAVVLAGGTAYGVTHAANDDTERVSQDSNTSQVTPYGDR